MRRAAGLSLFTAATLGCLVAAPSRMLAQYVVTGFSSASWGASDATLGVSAFIIEDFEDSTLAPGLLVGWASEAGDVTPAPTLPATFDPVTQDPNGTAFQGGAWDAGNVLVNTRTNQSFPYTAVSNWGDIILQFATPVSSVGFSLQQNEMDVGVFVNGSSIGTLQGLTGIAPNGGRYGYIRVDVDGGAPITSLRLSNARSSFYDGFVIDHLAFAPIPESSTLALLLPGIALLVCTRRRFTWRP